MTLTRNKNTTWQFDFTDPDYTAGDLYTLYIMNYTELTLTPGTTQTGQFLFMGTKKSYHYTVLRTRGSDKFVTQTGEINVI